MSVCDLAEKNRWHVVWPNCLKALSQIESNDCQRWIKHQVLGN